MSEESKYSIIDGFIFNRLNSTVVHPLVNPVSLLGHEFISKRYDKMFENSTSGTVFKVPCRELMARVEGKIYCEIIETHENEFIIKEDDGRGTDKEKVELFPIIYNDKRIYICDSINDLIAEFDRSTEAQDRKHIIRIEMLSSFLELTGCKKTLSLSSEIPNDIRDYENEVSDILFFIITEYVKKNKQLPYLDIEICSNESKCIISEDHSKYSINYYSNKISIFFFKLLQLKDFEYFKLNLSDYVDDNGKKNGLEMKAKLKKFTNKIRKAFSNEKEKIYSIIYSSIAKKEPKEMIETLFSIIVFLKYLLITEDLSGENHEELIDPLSAIFKSFQEIKHKSEIRSLNKDEVLIGEVNFKKSNIKKTFFNLYNEYIRLIDTIMSECLRKQPIEKVFEDVTTGGPFNKDFNYDEFVYDIKELPCERMNYGEYGNYDFLRCRSRYKLRIFEKFDDITSDIERRGWQLIPLIERAGLILNLMIVIRTAETRRFYELNDYEIYRDFSLSDLIFEPDNKKIPFLYLKSTKKTFNEESLMTCNELEENWFLCGEVLSKLIVHYILSIKSLLSKIFDCLYFDEKLEISTDLIYSSDYKFAYFGDEQLDKSISELIKPINLNFDVDFLRNGMFRIFAFTKLIRANGFLIQSLYDLNDLNKVLNEFYPGKEIISIEDWKLGIKYFYPEEEGFRRIKKMMDFETEFKD